MSKRDVRLLLTDILESIAKARRYIRGMTFQEFATNDLVVDAVTRNLEIIGEAARQIPEEIRRRHPEVPWRRVIGLRHIVVHEYFAVDIEILWTIVQENLPELERHLRQMLEGEE